MKYLLWCILGCAFFAFAPLSISAESASHSFDLAQFDMDFDFESEAGTGDYTMDGDDVIVDADGEFTLGVNAEADTITVSEGASLTLGVNSIVQEIILENAASVSFATNADVGMITGDAESLTVSTNSIVGTVEGNFQTLTLQTNSTIDTLITSVSGTTDIGVNASVDFIHLKTNTLIASTNADITEGIIYVYEDFDGGVNTMFSGKLTIYGNTALSVNSDVDGRYCALGKVGLGVNAMVQTYGWDGLLWNVDPILDFMTTDDMTEFSEVRDITEDFDVRIGDAFETIRTKNSRIASVQSQIAAEQRREAQAASENPDASVDTSARLALEGELSTLRSEKEAAKNEALADIEATFSELEPYIDEDERNRNLFSKIENIYRYAVEYENEGQIYNICNNTEITGSVNSAYYVNGNEFVLGWMTIVRRQIISDAEAASVDRLMDRMSDDKLANVNAKVDTIMGKLAEKDELSDSNEELANLLADVQEMIRTEMLYD